MRRLDIGGWRAALYGAKTGRYPLGHRPVFASLEGGRLGVSLLRGALWSGKYCSRMAPLLGNLLGKQVLEVELGLHRPEHEVGVVEAQVLLVGVGREGAATACPVLERGGCGFAGERAHVGV